MMSREELLAHYARVRAHYKALAPPILARRTRPARAGIATSSAG